MTDKTDTILRRGWSVFGKLVAGTRKGPSGERVRQLKKLQKQIGVRFLDFSLLEQALTHRSYSHVTSRTRDASNERMEFLGDSVLGLAVSQFLYLQFPDRAEGVLSKMKSLLVSRKVLSEVSREVGLGEYILLSGEESDMGGRDRDSILADSFEGVIGAIYLDQGYRAASKFIQDTLLAGINDILKDEENTNYKSLLQEYVQSRRLSHPVYRVRAEDGPEHEKEFGVEVVVRGEVWGVGHGKNKKDAEQSAAREALDNQKQKSSGSASASPVAAPVRTQIPNAGRASASKWRTSASPGNGGRGATTSEGVKPERPERGERGERVDDASHGIRASRELLRTSRDARSSEPDRRNEARREAERVERDARSGEDAGATPSTQRRPERGVARGVERGTERGVERGAERAAPRRRPEERTPDLRSAEGRAAESRSTEAPGTESREFQERRRRRDEPRRGRPAAPTDAPEVAASAGISPSSFETPEASAPFGDPGAPGETGRTSTGGRRRGRRGGRGRGRGGVSSTGVGASEVPQVEGSLPEEPVDRGFSEDLGVDAGEATRAPVARSRPRELRHPAAERRPPLEKRRLPREDSELREPVNRSAADVEFLPPSEPASAPELVPFEPRILSSRGPAHHEPVLPRAEPTRAEARIETNVAAPERDFDRPPAEAPLDTSTPGTGGDEFTARRRKRTVKGGSRR